MKSYGGPPSCDADSISVTWVRERFAQRSATRRTVFSNAFPRDAFTGQGRLGTSRSSSVVQLSRTDSGREFASAARTMMNRFPSAVTA